MLRFEFVACSILLLIFIHSTEGLICRTDLNEKKNEEFFDIAKACSANRGSMREANEWPWSQPPSRVHQHHSTNGKFYSPDKPEGGDGDDRGRSSGYGRGHSERYNNGYDESNSRNHGEDYRSRNNYDNSEARFESNSNGQRPFIRDGNGHNDRSHFHERQGQYKVKVQYGPDAVSNYHNVSRVLRATRITANVTPNKGGKNNGTSTVSKGSSSVLEEMDACVVQCIFKQMEMLTDDARPDKASVIGVMTQRIRDPELKEFIQESIEECIDLIESEPQDVKCEYSKNFIVCLENKGRKSCDDWDETLHFTKIAGSIGNMNSMSGHNHNSNQHSNHNTDNHNDGSSQYNWPYSSFDNDYNRG